MNVEQARCDALDNLKPLGPIQYSAVIMCVQMLLKTTIRHVIVDQKKFMFEPAIPKQLHEVAAPEAPNASNMGNELLHPLL